MKSTPNYMEDKCRGHYDVNGKDNKPFYVCSLCDCVLGLHGYYYHCPLLDNEVICDDCCHLEAEKEDVIRQLKELGKEYTREEIDKICAGCGNRCVKTSNVIYPSEVKDEGKK